MTEMNPEAFRPGVGIQCSAKVNHRLQWTGTKESLIDLAEKLSENNLGQGLDSHDLGDAMGFFIGWVNDPRVEGEIHVETAQGTLDVMTVPELFVWEGVVND